MPIFQITPAHDLSHSVTVAGKGVSIGRHPENTFPIDDGLASRYHCVIEPTGSAAEGTDGIVLKDLGSRNGTKLNGERIAEDTLLADGDVIRVGKHEFTVHAEASLKERQIEARSKAPLKDPTWLVDLRELIQMIPPKGGLDDAVEIIDGRGKSSGAITSDTDGSKAVRLMLLAASKSRATDIHCEPKGEGVNIRMRVDGQMVGIAELPNAVGELVFGVIKTSCQMRQASREAVLDGHFSARFQGRRVDYRVSFTPSVHGQKLVVRVLDMRDAPTRMAELNLPPYMHERIRQVCDKDSGLLLVCGPTGSGKTTTLYNALREIDREKKNVITIEDPVEYRFAPKKSIISQREIGIDVPDYKTALRYVVRQDPDIVFIGEMRDHDTVLAAIQAAETGHLVFATLHTADTMQSFNRILEFFPREEHNFIRSSLSNTLRAILAQKLLPAVENFEVKVVPAVEVLLNSPIVQQKIREGEENDIPAIINGSTAEGMVSFTKSLSELVKKDWVSTRVAMSFAPNRDALDSELKGLEVKAQTLVHRIRPGAH